MPGVPEYQNQCVDQRKHEDGDQYKDQYKDQQEMMSTASLLGYQVFTNDVRTNCCSCWSLQAKLLVKQSNLVCEKNKKSRLVPGTWKITAKLESGIAYLVRYSYLCKVPRLPVKHTCWDLIIRGATAVERRLSSYRQSRRSDDRRQEVVL